MIIILSFILLLQLPGDIRARYGFTRPLPAGVLQGTWQGGADSFYQRLRFDPGNWKAVVITEKDPGEDWGDLVSGGLSWHGTDFSAAAGALRTQFATGLVFGNSGLWASSDPLSMSKPQPWRMRLGLAESPGIMEGEGLTGVAVAAEMEGFTTSAVLGLSWLDHTGSGLHRTESELDNRFDTREELAAARVGWGPAGISFATLRRSGAVDFNGSRIGADVLLQRGSGLVTGEVVTDMDSTADFVLSAGTGSTRLRHSVTVSRSTGGFPRAVVPFGTGHELGAGYGLRWRFLENVVSEGGLLLLDCGDGSRFKTGLLFTERPGNRTELAQRIRYSEYQGERTLNVKLSLNWRAGAGSVLTLKAPFVRYTDQEGGAENGYGAEARLRHQICPTLDLSVSASASDTDGWNSRVYVYSLSFPGEFGSAALQGRSLLLQLAVNLHISDDTQLRARIARLCREGCDSLGSGGAETGGPCATDCALQLDWDF